MMQQQQVAPLVSPEAVEDAEIVKESSAATLQSTQAVGGTASVYIKAVTEDESSTDPLVNLPPPPPPPRPSKAITPTSEDEIKDADDHEEVEDDDEDETSNAVSSQHWGPERRVEISRVPGQGLGISIVGGKIDAPATKAGEEGPITGIFIKNVLDNSPAGESGLLFTGDRILEVDGHDLRSASHDKAVEVIRQSGQTVSFTVQSLMATLSSANNTMNNPDEDAEDSSVRSDISESNLPAIPADGEQQQHQQPVSFALFPKKSDFIH